MTKRLGQVGKSKSDAKPYTAKEKADARAQREQRAEAREARYAPDVEPAPPAPAPTRGRGR